MSRINTNISSMIAVNALNKNNMSLQTSLQRLSTGYRINSGKDDPAGLIASESLKAEQQATSTAISNAQRADNIIGTAEGSLSEVSNLLVSMQGLVGDAANQAGLSQDEKDADQLQVDSILSTINRIANSSSFEGVKLLNGTYDYTTSGLSTTSAFTSMSINSAKVGATTLAVNVSVITSAQTGKLEFLGSSNGLNGASTVSIAGNLGTVQLSFASSTKSSAIVASVNQFKDSTGVTAILSSDNKSVTLISNGYGTSQFVSVTSSNTTALSTVDVNNVATGSSYGRNATLTVNGTSAISDGLSVKAVFGDLLDVNFTLNAAANTNGAAKTFGITGGGATFSLGAQVNTANTASIGIGNINTGSIGKVVSNGQIYSLSDLGSGKAAAVNTGDTSLAQNIVNKAIQDVSNLRGRLGAFQSNVLGSTIDSLNVALENVSSSESAITDTDFATETANMTRNQILVQAADSVLQQANSAPQNVLKLLGG
ncbi:MAG TPA: flagellin [Verrucomicrobiae bacterium]|nr:flagellin [Verrucomicrobiae bacterium]HVX84504.1 flagellin [Phycisphaerae bacterium]